jgi:hypothetical protein
VAQHDVRWRATGPCLPTLTSKAGLLAESRLALRTYADLKDLAATRQALIDGGLLQRSRVTRLVIAKTIQRRLVGWHPPAWVCDDLVACAQLDQPDGLQALLLLHTARQDTLLYSVVQGVIVPRWRWGDRIIIRGDVQRFLDEAQPAHPEIGGWSHQTREKLAGNVLSILRDYGLLQGTARKRIVEPVIPLLALRHLAQLLQEEGIASEDIAAHPDWQLWLWEAGRVRAALQAMPRQEAVP